MPGAFAFAFVQVRWELRWIFLHTQYSGFSVQPTACSACGTRRVAFCQFVVGASRRSAAPGREFIASQLLARSSSALTRRALPAKVEAFMSGFVECFICRAQTEVAVAQSSFLSSSSTVPCSRAMPNPSINRTANGGSHLLASATSVPPLSAGYLKRWASR